MTIVIKAINGDHWAQLTAFGESGMVWLQSRPEHGQVVLNHSAVGSGALIVDDSYFMPDSKNKLTPVAADDSQDVFYARCSVPGETADIAVDVT